jgi:hypothetical protein
MLVTKKLVTDLAPPIARDWGTLSVLAAGGFAAPVCASPF